MQLNLKDMITSSAVKVLTCIGMTGGEHFCAILVMREKMFEELEKINRRPDPFEFYTAIDLWIDEHTSKQMLSFHLNEAIDVSSRNAEFINRSAEWIVSEFKIGRDTKIADFGCGPGLYTVTF